MKKTIIGIVIIIALGGGIYFLSQRTAIPGTGDMGLIESAYFGRGSVVCTFINPESEYGGEEKMTAYIKGGNVRIFPDESEEYEDFGFESALLKDGVYYFWEGNEGMKLSMKEDDSNLPFYVIGEDEKVVYDEGVNVDCRRTSIDDSMFEIPSEVDFFDMDEMLFEFDDYDYMNDGEFDDSDWQDYYNEDYGPMEWTPEMIENFEGLEDF